MIRPIRVIRVPFPDFRHFCNNAVAASRRNGPLAGKGGMGRILRVEIVVLSASTAIVSVRRRNLQNLDPHGLNKAKQAGPITAGGLDPNPSPLKRRKSKAERRFVVELIRRARITIARL